MIPYILLFVYIFIVAFLCKNDEKPHKFVILAFIGLFVIYGLRNAYAIGIDTTGSYLNYFTNIPKHGVDTVEHSSGFYYLTRILYRITGGNYQIFISIIAGFVSYAYYRLVDRYSVNPFLSIMWYIGLLFYIFMFSALKQSLAMAILTFAFDAITKKKWIRFYVLVIIATLIHGPALIFLPAYLLSKIKNRKYYFILIVAAFFIVFIFRDQILELMRSFYDSGEEMRQGDVSFIGGRVVGILIIIVVGYILRPVDDSDSSDNLYTILLYFLGISAILQTFCYYNNIFERLANYYFQFSILFVPLMFEKRKEENYIISYQTVSAIQSVGPYVVTVFSIVYFFLYLNSGESHFFVPYKFFWQ